MNATRELPIDSIRLDGGTQSRITIDEAYIAELMEVENLPPPIVFVENDTFWLADGFHRYHRAKRAGQKTIACACKHGSKRDAILYSLKANSTHGLRRTQEDKRKIVNTFLDDKEWSKWSNRTIAEYAHVSHTMVSNLRAERIAAKGGKVESQPCKDATSEQGEARESKAPGTVAATQSTGDSGSTTNLTGLDDVDDSALPARQFAGALRQHLVDRYKLGDTVGYKAVVGVAKPDGTILKHLVNLDTGEVEAATE